MPVTKWNPDKVMAKLLVQETKLMGQAAAIVAGRVKTKLNVGYSTSQRKSRRDGHVIDAGASKPGEPPRKRSGDLYRSIFFKVMQQGARQVVGIVYSTSKYSRRLEKGFIGRDAAGRVVDQKPRPFLRVSLVESYQDIKRILKVK